MSNKLYTYFTLILSILTNLLGIISIFTNLFKESSFSILIGFICFLISSIILGIDLYYKNNIIKNRYYGLKSLALSGKVHSLRLLLLLNKKDTDIINRNIKNNFKEYKIINAHIKYLLKKNEDDNNFYDVTYHFSFELLGGIKTAKNYSSYIINEIHNDNIKVNLIYQNQNYQIKSEPVEDKVKDIANKYVTLYKFNFSFPNDGLKHKEFQTLSYYYTIKKELNLKHGDDFLIIPLNYGSNFNTFSVELEFIDDTNLHYIGLERHELDLKNNKEIPMENFIHKEKDGNMIYYTNNLSGRINELYFVHVYSE